MYNNTGTSSTKSSTIMHNRHVLTWHVWRVLFRHTYASNLGWLYFLMKLKSFHELCDRLMNLRGAPTWCIWIRYKAKRLLDSKFFWFRKMGLKRSDSTNSTTNHGGKWCPVCVTDVGRDACHSRIQREYALSIGVYDKIFGPNQRNCSR